MSGQVRRRGLPLSPLPAERALQWWALRFAGWWLVSLVLVGLLQAGDGRDLDDLLPVRAVLGVVALGLVAHAHVLVTRHREAVATVAGMQRQYALVGLVGVVLGATGWPAWWWASAGVVLGGLAGWWRVRRVPTVPAAEMTERVDYDRPEHWQPRSAFWARPVASTLALVGLALLGTALLVGALLLGAELLG